MNKSDFLDELRLEIGLALDHAKSLRDFYIGVVHTLGCNNMIQSFSSGLYETADGEFVLFEQVGSTPMNDREKFGEGKLSLCAIRGMITVYHAIDGDWCMAPFYQKDQHLRGILTLNIPRNTYRVTEEDIIFLKEVSKFMGTNIEHFSE